MEDNRISNYFTLALHVLGNLAVAALVFLSMMYITGDYTTSGLTASAFLLLLVIGTYLLTSLKKRERSYTNKTPEVILFIVLFLPLFAGSILFTVHWLNITARQDEITKIALSRLDSTQIMVNQAINFADRKISDTLTLIDVQEDNYLRHYDDLVLWKNLYSFFTTKNKSGEEYLKPRLTGPQKLDPVIRTKFEKDLRDRVKSAKAEKKQILQDEYSITFIKNEIDSFDGKTRLIFKKWDRFRIHNAYLDIDRKYAMLLGAAQAVMPDFKYPPLSQHDINLKSPVVTLTTCSIVILGVTLLLVVFIFLFILSPYIFTARTKPPFEVIEKGPRTRKSESVSGAFEYNPNN